MMWPYVLIYIIPHILFSFFFASICYCHGPTDVLALICSFVWFLIWFFSSICYCHGSTYVFALICPLIWFLVWFCALTCYCHGSAYGNYPYMPIDMILHMVFCPYMLLSSSYIWFLPFCALVPRMVFYMPTVIVFHMVFAANFSFDEISFMSAVHVYLHLYLLSPLNLLSMSISIYAISFVCLLSAAPCPPVLTIASLGCFSLVTTSVPLYSVKAHSISFDSLQHKL